VRSTIELAHSLGLRTVAEGIEDASTLERLRSLGCELAQGFHLSKPLPGASLGRWWDARTGAVRPLTALPQAV
jgi:EAL domain-containing protein (putative c-di-GMP-specific phosphodiesterase class I)